MQQSYQELIDLSISLIASLHKIMDTVKSFADENNDSVKSRIDSGLRFSTSQLLDLMNQDNLSSYLGANRYNQYKNALTRYKDVSGLFDKDDPQFNTNNKDWNQILTWLQNQNNGGNAPNPANPTNPQI